MVLISPSFEGFSPDSRIFLAPQKSSLQIPIRPGKSIHIRARKADVASPLNGIFFIVISYLRLISMSLRDL